MATDNIINCAHRGASAHAPENTLAALSAAIEDGADMAEVDVQLSADGLPVLIHDFELDRTTDGTGPVANQTLAQLKRLDAGSWFAPRFRSEGLPTLREALDLTAGCLALNLELKAPGTAAEPWRALAAQVIALVRESGRQEDCLLTSFAHPLIDYIRRDHPDLSTGYIVGPGALARAQIEADVPVLSLFQGLVDGPLLEAARRTGKQIHAWTANSNQDLERLVDLGLDAIITNHPDRLATILAAREG